MFLRTLCLGELDTNCYILWADNHAAIVIDPADNADKILEVIETEGLTVSAVVLTHAHFDHMLATKLVCDTTGALLYVGKNDEPALADPVRNLSGVFQMCDPICLTADRCLQEGDRLMVGEVPFTVWETPGHTPGCICLLGDDMLFSGDTLFRDSIGRVDFPGGDVPAMLKSLRRLAALPGNTAVYSGHGPATTIEREVKRNPYLQCI